MLRTSPFPAFADPRRAYIALSDCVGLLWLRHRWPLQVCGFCRTAGSRKARCPVCGTMLMPYATSATSSASTADGGRGVVPLAPIMRVMARLLIVPLVLFVAFCAWYALHNRSQSYSSQGAQSAAPSSIAQDRVEAAPQGSQHYFDTPVAPLAPRAEKSEVDPAKRPRVAFVLKAPVSTAFRRSTSYKFFSDDRSTGLCAGRNVLMHAVCMNNLCASSEQARRPQCTAAVAQRRLDEARRNLIVAN